jgi:hypothetical protein
MDAGEKAKIAQQILSDVFYHMQAWRVTVSTETRVTTPCSRKSGWGFVIRNHLGNAVATGSGSADLLMSA